MGPFSIRPFCKDLRDMLDPGTFPLHLLLTFRPYLIPLERAGHVCVWARVHLGNRVKKVSRTKKPSSRVIFSAVNACNFFCCKSCELYKKMNFTIFAVRECNFFLW